MANPYDQFDANPYDQFTSTNVSPTAEPSLLGRYVSGYMKAGLPGIAWEGAKYGNEKLNKAALEAGGKVAETAGRMGIPSEIAGGLGVGANMAVNAIPMVFGGGIGAKAAPAVEGGAKWLMQTALKPTKADVVSGKAGKAIQTYFDEGVNPTLNGLDDMKQIISGLNDRVNQVIANSPASIKTDVQKYMQQVLDKFRARPDRLQAEADIANAEQIFTQHPLVKGATDIPIQTAQDLKRGYQQAIGDRGYGEMKTAATEAEKAIARGLREKISAAAPEVADINARESQLINAMKVAQRGSGVLSGNKNPFGLGLLNTHTLPLWLLDRFAGGKAGIAQILYGGARPISTFGGAMGGGLYDLLNSK